MSLRRPYVSGALVVALALFGAVCLGGRTQYFPGSALAVLRWPVAAVLALLLVRASRRGHRVLASIAGVTAAALVLEWAAVRWHSARPPELDPARTPVLKVVTHNVLYRGGDPERTAALLRTVDADVIALQEVTPAWVARLSKTLQARYPHRLLAPQAGTLGYALFSRHPLRDETYLPKPSPRAFAQCATVVAPQGEIPLCNVHFYSPSRVVEGGRSVRTQAAFLMANARLRAEQWEQVREHVERRGGGRAIVAGDFNTADFEPLYRQITRRYVDALADRTAFPGRTFPNPKLAPLGPLVRIDYVMTLGALQPVAAEIHRATGSDHLPVRAVLRVGPVPQATASR